MGTSGDMPEPMIAPIMRGGQNEASPVSEISADLGAIVRHDLPRVAAGRAECFEDPRHPHPADGRVHDQRFQALPVEAVYDAQHPQALSAARRVAHEIQGPLLVWGLRSLQWLALPPSSGTAATPTGPPPGGPA